MIRAIARIETLPARGRWFRILACPAAPEHEGAVLAAGREVEEDRIGQYVVVKFHPEELFGYECKEALQ